MMGEIADLMLDGRMCERCYGKILEGGVGGYPRYCSARCARDREVDFDEKEPK